MTTFTQSIAKTGFTAFTAFFFALFFLLSGPADVCAQNRQHVPALSSPVYSYMDAIYLESGLVHPNKARPWTGEEIAFLLERVSRSELSRAGKNAYDYISRKIDIEDSTDDPADDSRLLEMGDAFKMRAGVTTTLEGYYRHNIDKDSETVGKDYSWQHGYEERKPLLEIPLEFTLGNSLYMLSKMSVKEEHATVDIRKNDDGEYPGGVSNNYSNLVIDDPNSRVDLYFPYRAFVSTGGSHWNFRLGRDSLSWGNGNSGNTMLSDYSDYYDFVGLSFYGKRLKLTNVYTVMDPYSPDADEGELYVGSHAFMGRRLDIRVTDRIMLSLNESVTLSDTGNNLVKDLNYLMIFHNRLEQDRSNSLMTLELSVNPIKRINLYGQYVMDEYSVKYESDRTGGGGPHVFGWLAGIEGVHPVDEGYLSWWLEGAYTNPWLYHRREAPYYYNVRRYWSLTNDMDEYVVKPIGYRYGPDTVAGFFRTKYDVPEGISAEFSVHYILQGENKYLPDVRDDFSEMWDPVKGDPSPSGTAEKQLILHMSAEYPFRSWLSAGAGMYHTSVRNLGNVKGRYRQDLELTSFVTVRLR